MSKSHEPDQPPQLNQESEQSVDISKFKLDMRLQLVKAAKGFYIMLKTESNHKLPENPAGDSEHSLLVFFNGTLQQVKGFLEKAPWKNSYVIFSGDSCYEFSMQ